MYMGCLDKKESIEVYKGGNKVNELCTGVKTPISGVISSKGQLLVSTLCDCVLVFELSDPLVPKEIAEIMVSQMVTVMHVVESTDFIIMGQRNGHVVVLDTSYHIPKITFQNQLEELEKKKVSYVCKGERPR